MDISFVGTKNEIEFIQKNNSNSNEITWVPLSLDALVYLDMNKKKYIDPLKYFNNLDHRKGIDFQKKYFKSITFKKNLSDSLKQRYFGIFAKFFNSIFFILSIYENLKKKHKIDQVIVSGWGENNFITKNKNNFISLICSEIFKNEKIKFKTIKKISTSIEKITFSYNFEKFIIPSEKYILITNPFYNFKRIIPHAKKNKLKIYYFEFNKINFIKKNIYKLIGITPIIILKKLVKKEVKTFKKNSIIRKYKNFDLTNLISFKKVLVQNEIDNINNQNKIINSFIIKRKPSLIIANLIRGFNGYLVELAKKIKIPSLSISHGTLSKGYNKYDTYFQKKLSEELISRKFTYIACQSKIFKSFLIQQKIKKFLCTGNLIFSQTKVKKRKYILYAVTQRYFVNNHYYGIETFFEFYQNLKEFDKLSLVKNLPFLIKLHPNFSYLKSKLEKKFKNLKFTNQPLNKILPFTKATITFSSSSIEDSLYSNVPIILYDPYKRYKHCEASKNFIIRNEPIYYVQSIKNLQSCLNTISLSKKIKFNKVTFEGNYKDNFKKIFSNLKLKKNNNNRGNN